jgi:cytochrome c oxidase subunit IV
MMTDVHDHQDDNEYAHRELDQNTVDSFVASRTGHDDHGDVTVVLGREIPLPLYTVVFLALGILTIIEVLIGGIEGAFRVPLLLGFAVVKAYLVVYYYMHLKTDSRVFAAVLAVPVFVAIVSLLFALVTPPGNY